MYTAARVDERAELGEVELPDVGHRVGQRAQLHPGFGGDLESRVRLRRP